uniref:Kinesin motor domain-containing protein n=1 Tax=Pipistrellus kuhlii TaxID=59472 RepID=A0A7J8B1L4_PIPKU|nr:hypothetical protein mPipKuh1_007787 [Pipistrellus kuhlii]
MTPSSTCCTKGSTYPLSWTRSSPRGPPSRTFFQEVQALITSCIDRFNVWIFAYGQTGAGRTYTMEGTPENPGNNQRALQLLFSEVQEKASDWEFTITVSAAEIYNKALRDLSGQEPQEKLEIRLCPNGIGQLYVPGLMEFRVQSVDINKVFEFGHTIRTTEFTNRNEHSSRTHALLMVTVSPAENTSETLYSLKFAQRVRSVELGPGPQGRAGVLVQPRTSEWEPACQTRPPQLQPIGPGTGTSSRPEEAAALGLRLGLRLQGHPGGCLCDGRVRPAGSGSGSRGLTGRLPPQL